MITNFLSNLSITKQILLSFVPTLLVLGFLALLSHNNFNFFFQNFSELDRITDESKHFLQIEKDITELQRNILVYSYVGYKGVLKKIEHTEQKLDEHFKGIADIASNDAAIHNRFQRIYQHFTDYKKGFAEAVKEKEIISSLRRESLQPIILEILELTDQIKSPLSKQRQFQDIQLLLEIELYVEKISHNIQFFEIAYSVSKPSNTQDYLDKMTLNTRLLLDRNNSSATKEKLAALMEQIEEFEQPYRKLSVNSSVYLHLINVVLAGKAAEINALADELNQLMYNKSSMLHETIVENIHSSRQSSLFFSLLAATIGILFSMMIAGLIVKPIAAISNTLSSLAEGKNKAIPYRDRKDELGKMAKSAQEFKSMANQLKQQTNELEEFAYRTSHDLRSPLISSISLLSLAKKAIEKDDPDKSLKSINLTVSSLTKLELLVQDILELAKTKNMDEEPKQVDIPQMVEDSITKFTQMEHFERLTIETDFDISTAVNVKKSRLQLVIENLISNAIKYQDLEKSSSYLKICAETESNMLKLAVEDNGIGIPKEQQDKIFSMFKRFHPKISFGSGLGLYMMKKSVEIMNGTISFKSLKHGSKFVVRIPVE